MDCLVFCERMMNDRAHQHPMKSYLVDKCGRSFGTTYEGNKRICRSAQIKDHELEYKPGMICAIVELSPILKYQPYHVAFVLHVSDCGVLTIECDIDNEDPAPTLTVYRNSFFSSNSHKFNRPSAVRLWRKKANNLANIV